jgi:hypothetical protein
MLNDSARNAGATAANAGITIIPAKNPHRRPHRIAFIETSEGKARTVPLTSNPVNAYKYAQGVGAGNHLCYSTFRGAQVAALACHIIENGNVITPSRNQSNGQDKIADHMTY